MVSVLELVGWRGGGKPKYLYHKMCTFFQLKLGQHPSPSIWACRHCLPDFPLSEPARCGCLIAEGEAGSSHGRTLGTQGLQWLWLLFPCPLVPWCPRLGLPSLLSVLARRRWQWPILCRPQAWGEPPGFAPFLLSSRSPSPCHDSSTHRGRLPIPRASQAVQGPEGWDRGEGTRGAQAERCECTPAWAPLSGTRAIQRQVSGSGRGQWFCTPCAVKERTCSGSGPVQPWEGAAGLCPLSHGWDEGHCSCRAGNATSLIKVVGARMCGAAGVCHWMGPA